MSEDERRPDEAPASAEDTTGRELHLAATWSGPLPPPAVVGAFDDLVENGAERIFRQWEEESAHRREMERRELAIVGRSDLLRRFFALLFALSALSVSALAIVHGQEWIAAILGGGTIASVVWAFIRTNEPS